jgi:hypothetical protein
MKESAGVGIKRGLADSVQSPPKYERTGAAAAKFTRNATSPAAGLGWLEMLGRFEFKRRGKVMDETLG